MRIISYVVFCCLILTLLCFVYGGSRAKEVEVTKQKMEYTKSVSPELKSLVNDAILDLVAYQRSRYNQKVYLSSRRGMRMGLYNPELDSLIEKNKTAKVRFVKKLKALCKYPKGIKYLETKLQTKAKTILIKLEHSLKAVQEASNSEEKVLAADEYNRTLSSFVGEFGCTPDYLRFIKPNDTSGYDFDWGAVDEWSEYSSVCSELAK
jgi:hypothetical protein